VSSCWNMARALHLLTSRWLTGKTYKTECTWTQHCRQRNCLELHFFHQLWTRHRCTRQSHRQSANSLPVVMWQLMRSVIVITKQFVTCRNKGKPVQWHRQWETLTFHLACRWAFRWARVWSKSRLKSKSSDFAERKT